ncbi:MAG: zinc ribbon domain-containing protein [Clostridium sp.]|uniref:zinc ribbon domain-containing protein n=1 Tax=Clostridium sp. TaxID=1506 RepID=UPI003F3D9E22
MVCDKCGKEMKKDAIFCTGCGAEVNSDALDSGKDEKRSLEIGKKLTIHLKITLVLFMLGTLGVSLDWVKIHGIEGIEGAAQSGLALGAIVVLVPFIILLVLGILKIFGRKVVNIILDIIGIGTSGFISIFMIILYSTVSKVPGHTESLGIGLYLTIAVSVGFLINSSYGLYRSIKSK